MTQDSTQRARIERAIYVLITDGTKAGCFYGTTISFLQLVEDSTIETAATDGIRLFYNPSYIAGLTDAELRGLLAHEAEHCMRLHFLRMGSRELKLWNVATDHEINLGLLKAGFTLPPGALANPAYAETAAESVYAAEFRAREKQESQNKPGKPGDSGKQQSGSGKPGNGSGKPENGNGKPGDSGKPEAGKPATGSGKPGTGTENGTGSGSAPERAPDPGRCGGIIAPRAPDGTPEDSAKIAAQWQARTRQTAAIAARRAGTMPGTIRAILETVENPPEDWREALDKFVSASMETESSWSRPNRRMINRRFYLPTQVSNGRGRVIWAIDVSGSIFHSRKTYSEFQKAAQAAMDSGAADCCTILFCDTQIKAVKEFQAGETLDFNCEGGGGTKFSPVMDWINEHGTDAACLVYFTDMECDDFGFDPGLPVLWLNWKRPATAPYGEVIQLDPHQ